MTMALLPFQKGHLHLCTSALKIEQANSFLLLLLSPKSKRLCGIQNGSMILEVRSLMSKSQRRPQHSNPMVNGVFHSSQCFKSMQVHHELYSTSSPGSTSTKNPKRESRKKLKISSQPPANGTSDWIGPPDPISNIRPIKFYIPPNETDLEKDFRLRRENTLQWNHKFWAEHNKKFFKEKEMYVESFKEDGKNSKITADEMAVFYRKFLNENQEEHFKYNREWYRRNISLLWPAFKIAAIKLRKSLIRQR